MSLLSRLFGADPTKLVIKGERALESNHPAEALDLFRRAQDASPDDATVIDRAGEGLAAASRKLVEMNLEEADLSQEAGDLEAARHHLDTALQLCLTDGQRSRVAAREALLKEALGAGDGPQRLFTTEGAIGEELLPEEQWEHLLATLDEEVAEDYMGRSEAFRDALLALNDGRPEEAEPVLREMLEEDDDDPLVRFELGRTLLLMEKFSEAAAEMALAREDLGFEPLDRIGMLQIALMEGDALLNDKRPDEALRLADEALDERGDDVSLLFVKGRSERALGKHDAVEETMGRVTKLQPKLVEATILLAQSRVERDDLDGAAETLEAGIKRHCATGTCQAQPVSAPAARLLAKVYLDQDSKLDRVEDLLMQNRAALEGHMTLDDLVLWGRLHRQRGDLEALAEVREAALAALPPEAKGLRQEIERLLGE